MTEKKIDDVVQARKRLCEIASDLEYYRAVASYEMPESPNPTTFGGDFAVRFPVLQTVVDTVLAAGSECVKLR